MTFEYAVHKNDDKRAQRNVYQRHAHVCDR